jgi:putative membrane-bound dehydrogenase-like protein
MRTSLLAALLLSLVSWGNCFAQEAPIKILFLGDKGHHRPEQLFKAIGPHLDGRGVKLTYTEKLTDLSDEVLSKYDGLLIYANQEKIAPEQEAALLKFVEEGKGFIPVHCATYCFLNSPKYIELCGAQFSRHGTGDFRTRITQPNHPIMKGFDGFESWDETYVHTKHNEKNREVLEVRADQNGFEPWTWTRTQGKGRVFYTAWGHDERTWRNPGFTNLLERGIRWAVNKDPSVVPPMEDPQAFRVPEMTAKNKDVKPFEYIEVGPKIPHYVKSTRWGVQEPPYTKMQKPVPAEESLKHYVVPQGFKVELFASEPDLGGKPIAMTWDERGRLWVCETMDYPNELQPPGQGRDRIRICEDTDNDGKADKFTVFAEKLSIPTSMAFHKGGVIVQDGQTTIYLKDTTGDDVADERTVLFTGWAMGDTHGGVSNFQYGLDNWIWAMQGYNDSRPTPQTGPNAGKPGQRFRQGFFRFRPDGSDLEFVRSTDNNTWGLGITEEGLILGSTANHNPSVYMPIANRYYEKVRGWAPEVLRMISDTHLFNPITENIRQVDQFGGYTAGAGHAVYTARQYPKEFWNRTAFVCEPTGHLVGAFTLRRNGADFSSQNSFNLAASDDEWSAPIMAEVGPDGNVWVLDWYNYIIQHNPVPTGFQNGKGNAYESDLRDKRHGRVYRITYGEAAKPFTLKDASPEKLVETLKHPTQLWRKHAQRLLVERGKDDVVPALLKLVNDKSVDEAGLNVGAIHGLWTLLGIITQLDIKEIDFEKWKDGRLALVGALSHPSAGVRRTAIQVVPISLVGHIGGAGDAERFLVADIEKVLDGEMDAQVQLAALLLLADLPANSLAGQKVAQLFLGGTFLKDKWLADGLTVAAAVHAEDFLPALAQVTTTKQDAGVAPRATKLIETVAEHFARGKPNADQVNKVLASIVKAESTTVDAFFTGLGKGWPSGHRVAISADTEKALIDNLERLPTGAKSQAVRLASLWGSKAFEKYTAEIVETLMKTLDDDSKSEAARVAAAKEIIDFRPGDSEVLDALLAKISPQTAGPIAAGLLEACGNSAVEDVGARLVAKLAALTPQAKSAALRILLSRENLTAALLDGVDSGAARLDELALDQKQVLANHPDMAIRDRAKKLLAMGGGLPSADRVKVIEELKMVVDKTGDATNGKAIYTKNCAKCHQIRGEGVKIGPDLTGMAVHPKLELLTHILDPSRSVEGNFRTYTILLNDGRVLNGMLAAETRTSIEIIDTEGKKNPIQRADVDELTAGTKSLMPEGFEKQMKPEEIGDLLEFLTLKGKYVPIDLRKAATVVSTKGMFFDQNDRSQSMVVTDDWAPKQVGEIPFLLVDPNGDRSPNFIMLQGPRGTFAGTMPKSTSAIVNCAAKKLHLLGGVGGWSYPYSSDKSVSLIVRLKYADGSTEDHELLNGIHIADYIRKVDVPESQFAFSLRQGKQMRMLSITPKKSGVISEIEFVDGGDDSAPIVIAVTVETAG